MNPTTHNLLCTWVKDDGRKCRAPKVRGTDYCLFHPPSFAENLQTVAREEGVPESFLRNPGALDNLELDTYSDVVNWKKQIMIKVNLGILSEDRGETLCKMLSSLESSMLTRDKADPDKESKRQFSIEAAIQAARKLSGSEAARILRSGTTNFMDFLNSPTIDIVPICAEDIDETPNPRPITKLIKTTKDEQAELREKLFAPTNKPATTEYMEAKQRIEDIRTEILKTYGKKK